MNKFKKLHEAKREFGRLFKTKDNPFFKSKYADLNALLSTVEGPLSAKGIMILQPIIGSSVATILIDVETGDEIVRSEMEIPENKDPQKLGSSVTYLRRYTLQSLLAIQAEDDDGNRAAKKTLTSDQFNKLQLLANHKYIKNYLGYDMTSEQREVLTNIRLEDGKS